MKSRSPLSNWMVAVCLFAMAGIMPSGLAETLYQNPVMAGDHPDPSIIRVGKDYWATCTSSEWGPEFPLLHSRDLVNWETVGAVFPHRPEWAIGKFWAPEIAEYQGRYFIYYVGHKRNGPLAVGVATAEKPDGPYTDHGPMVAQEVGSIDPVPVTDENGDRYLVWKEDGNSRQRPTPIWAQRLNEDGTKLTGEAKELIRNDAPWEGGLVEGPFILRRGSWFYLFYSGSGCCGTGCDYALGVARSHSLLGPWEKNPANPILAGNKIWKCPGHGSIVADERGRYWLLYHAYSATGSIFTGREALLDEVKFGADDWPAINGGTGPSAQAASPFGKSQRQADGGFVDEFKGSRLQPGWQWPQAHEPSIHLRGGYLALASGTGPERKGPDAILARPTLTANYVATTVVDTSGLGAGNTAGLCAFGDSANAIGLSVGGGKLILWRRDRGGMEELATTNAPAGKSVQLRLTAKQGYRFRFAASGDGRQWMAIGDDLAGKQLPPWDRSIRVALTVDGKEHAEGQFDSIRIVPTLPAAAE